MIDLTLPSMSIVRVLLTYRGTLARPSSHGNACAPLGPHRFATGETASPSYQTVGPNRRPPGAFPVRTHWAPKKRPRSALHVQPSVDPEHVAGDETGLLPAKLERRRRHVPGGAASAP